MTTLLKQFHREYDFIYKNNDNVAGYDEAVKWFDDNQTKPEIKKHITALVNERGDFIASDREAGAFAFALEALNII